jgi:hypothetical protein
LQKLAQRFKDRIIVNISKSQTWISLQCSWSLQVFHSISRISLI